MTTIERNGKLKIKQEYFLHSEMQTVMPFEFYHGVCIILSKNTYLL